MTPTLHSTSNQHHHNLKKLLYLSKTMKRKPTNVVKPEKKGMLRSSTLKTKGTLLALTTENLGENDLVLEMLSERKDNLEGSLTKTKKREAHLCGKK